MRRLSALIALVMVLVLSGCDGDSDHKGEGDTSPPGVTEGVAVDPYIVGTVFFEDINNNGIRDAEEQLSTVTNESGYFSFNDPVAVGSTLVMLETGKHQGLPYSIILKRTITAADDGVVSVSPLTTLLSEGLTTEELMTMLNGAGLPWITDLQGMDLLADPMAGLEGLTATTVTDADLALLRTNFVAYSILEFINRIPQWDINSSRIESALETEDFAQLLFAAVELTCSQSMLEEADLNLASQVSGLPAMTMADVAETIPAILYWWAGEFYEDLVNNRYDFPVFEDISEQLSDFVLILSPYYYALNHSGDAAVNPADFLDSGLLPLGEDDFFMIANDGSAEVRSVDAGIALSEALFHDVSYVLGEELMHFTAAGDWEAIMADGDAVDRSGGTWTVDGNDLLVVDTSEERQYTLTLVGEWPSYLRFMTLDPVFDNQTADVVNIPMAKVRSIDSANLAGQTFLIDPDDCPLDNHFCGGRVVFGDYDDGSETGTATLYVFDNDSSTPAAADWWFADDHAVVIETMDETNELYFYGDDGKVVVVTSQGSTVTDVSAEEMFPPDRPEAIASGVFAVDSTVGEELTLYDNQQYSWSNGYENEEGTWSYDNSTGELTLSNNSGVAVRLWFYDVSGADPGEFPFYYEDYEGGTAVESGFDRLLYSRAAPIPAVNLALNQQVTANSNTIQGDAADIVDGDTTTTWYSYQGIDNTCQFVLDLGAEYSIGEIDIDLLQTEEITIESSLDGIDWTMRHQESNGLWLLNSTKKVSFMPSYQARYLRYTGQNAQTAWVGLSEFQVFAPE